MPLFLFVSGVFVKNKFDTEEKGMFVSKTIYFITLGILFQIALKIFSCLVMNSSFDGFNLFSFSGIPWYIISLGVFSIMTPLFSRLKPLFSITASIVFACVANIWDIPDFFALTRCVIYLPFYLAGFYLSPSTLISCKLFEKRTVKVIIATLVIVGVAVFFYTTSQTIANHIQWYSSAKRSYEVIWGKGIISNNGFVFLAILFRLAWYFAVSGFSLCIMMLIPKCNIPLFSKIGEHSLAVYIFHPFIYYTLNYFKVLSVLFPYQGIPTLLIRVVTSLAICILLGVPSLLSRPFAIYNQLCRKMTKRVLSNV